MPTAQKKISELSALTVAAGVDLLPIVDDPGGTPETKKITVANFFSNVSTNTLFSSNLRSNNNVFLDGVTTCNGSITINGNTAINGEATFSNAVVFNAPTVHNSEHTVFGSQDVDGTVTITGNLNFTNASCRIIFGDGSAQNTAFRVAGPYANDSAANTGGVTLNSLYYTASGEVRIRLT